MLEGIYRKNKNTYIIRYNKDGNSLFKEITPNKICFIPHPDGEYKNFITKEPLKKIILTPEDYEQNKSIFDIQYPNRWTKLNENISLTYPLWSKKNFFFKSRIWYLDIETIDLNDRSFPDPIEAKAPITHIQIFDDVDNINYIFMYKDIPEKNKERLIKKYPETKFIICDDEVDMLRKFSSLIQDKRPFIINAWNGNQFDFAYLFYRFKKLGLSSNRLSPLNKTSVNVTKNGIHKIEILGIELLDSLELYKKFTFGEKKSYSLDYIAKEELGEGEGKVDYGEYRNIFDFYDKNYVGFVEYAIRDTIVLKNIMEKTGIMDLAITMSREMGCNVSDIMGTVRPWEIYLKLEMYKRNEVFVENYYKVEGNIKGGFVRNPEKGYNRWVTSFDYNSLYPSLLNFNNISAETYIPYDKLPKELQELYDMFRDENEDLLLEQLPQIKQIMKKYPDITFSGLGFFKKDKQGLIPELVESFYYGRKKEKQKMLLADVIIANNKINKE